MVNVLAFYSVNLSLNPAEVYSFCVNLLLKRGQINKKRPGLVYLKKTRIESAFNTQKHGL